MEILNSKWIILVLVILSTLIILYLIGNKSAHSEITVNAPSAKVWNVITNTQQYDEWNSVINSLEGNLKEGEEVKFMFHQEEGNSYPISAKVKKVEPNKLLNQYGGTIGIMTYNHKYILEEANGVTKVTIHEDYRGIFVPFWNSEPAQKAYERMNEDIKRRVESLN